MATKPQKPIVRRSRKKKSYRLEIFTILLFFILLWQVKSNLSLLEIALITVATLLFFAAMALRFYRPAVHLVQSLRELRHVKSIKEGLEEHLGQLKTSYESQARDLMVFNQSLLREIEERRRVVEALRDKNIALENAIEGISQIDTQRRFLSVNKAYADLFGYAVDDMTGMQFERTVPPEDQTLIMKAYDTMFLHGKSEVEVQGIRKDGSLFYQQVVMVKWLDKQNHFTGHYAFVKDITGRKRAEEDLRRLNQELKELNETLEQRVIERTKELARSNAELEAFAYVVSHDLREPLRMITSYTQLLGQKYQEKFDQNAKEFIQFALDGAARMKDLINDLLTYSRVGASQEPTDFVSTDFKTVFETAITNLSVAIAENKAKVGHGSLPTVPVDSSQMVQLFQNLIANAIKFHGERSPEIKVEAQPQNGQWLFSIADNGIGIDPKHTDRIFEIFQRAPTGTKYPGTGIGLAICKKIVERHGGKIWVESRPGQGSTFYFTVASSPKEEAAQTPRGK